MKKIRLITLSLLLYSLVLFAFSRHNHTKAISSVASIEKCMTEFEKVAHLINYIQTLEGAVFIRNGKEYMPGEAADHLNSKWNKHKKKVETGKRIVSELATESRNKLPYHILFSDGKTVKCCDLLREELKKIEG